MSVTLFAGCGGGGGRPETGLVRGALASSSPRLDDGSSYESYEFHATASGSTTVTATAAFDTFLVVERVEPDGTVVVIAEDDDSGGGTNSAVAVDVVAGKRYNVIVTGVAANAAGAFELQYPQESLTRQRSAASRSAAATSSRGETRTAGSGR